MACRALKRALFPVGQGIPNLGLTSGQRVLIEYRNAGFCAVQDEETKRGLNADIPGICHAGQIDLLPVPEVSAADFSSLTVLPSSEVCTVAVMEALPAKAAL